METKHEVRLRVLEAVARHCSAREWNDIDNLIQKVRMVSDFVLDSRTVSSIGKPSLGTPKKQSLDKRDTA